MLNKLSISIFVVLVCGLFQKFIPLVLGLMVYFLLSIRNRINTNVFNQNEQNQSLRQDINSLSKNQSVITLDVRNLTKNIYGKTKEELRKRRQTKE